MRILGLVAGSTGTSCDTLRAGTVGPGRDKVKELSDDFDIENSPNPCAVPGTSLRWKIRTRASLMPDRRSRKIARTWRSREGPVSGQRRAGWDLLGRGSAHERADGTLVASGVFRRAQCIQRAPQQHGGIERRGTESGAGVVPSAQP